MRQQRVDQSRWGGGGIKGGASSAWGYRKGRGGRAGGTHNARSFGNVRVVVSEAAAVAGGDGVLPLAAEADGVHGLAAATDHPLQGRPNGGWMGVLPPSPSGPGPPGTPRPGWLAAGPGPGSKLSCPSAGPSASFAKRHPQWAVPSLPPALGLTVGRWGDPRPPWLQNPSSCLRNRARCVAAGVLRAEECGIEQKAWGFGRGTATAQADLVPAFQASQARRRASFPPHLEGLKEPPAAPAAVLQLVLVAPQPHHGLAVQVQLLVEGLQQGDARALLQGGQKRVRGHLEAEESWAPFK